MRSKWIMLAIIVFGGALLAATAIADTTPAGPRLPEIDRTFAIAAGLIVITIVGAFIDRRRSLARSLAG